MEHRTVESDVLIIGGGTAGCYAAIRLGENSGLRVALVDKADIRRSGCLAAGVNALNAYISEGYRPEDYVRYAMSDAQGVAREDLLLDLARRFNRVTHDMERRGLTILKDAQGRYVSRGWRNLKINGENIKPILASEVRKQKNVQIYEHVNITDFRMDQKVRGAYGFGMTDGTFYEFRAGAVLIATGGAAGLYRPNHTGQQSHQLWYPPFNTGAGYCMGILAGAEMTTFEMRFIALRCKDTIAPVGTIAQGIGARQVNAGGEDYEDRYDHTTAGRLWGTVTENREGRGPCYLRTRGISPASEEELYKAYLNMAPVQTLRWIDSGRGPAIQDVEIEGTEPYIVGGHAASGYWVDRERKTTLDGLFAAGDVAGGSPQKYVTGALAEGEIAAESIQRYLAAASAGKGETGSVPPAGNGEPTYGLDRQAAEKKAEYEKYLQAAVQKENEMAYSPYELETAMQAVMDEYAGGIRTDYRYHEAGLKIARLRIEELIGLLPMVIVKDVYDLLAVYEVRERLFVSLVLIHHLQERKETRWRGFQENADHPGKKPEYRCFVNSVMENGRIRMIRRELVRREPAEDEQTAQAGSGSDQPADRITD